MNEELRNQLQQFYPEIEDVLKNKVEELHDLGYKESTIEETWSCLIETTWRKRSEPFKLYEIVNDILLLTPNTYMLYITKKMNQSPDWLFKKFQ